MYTESNKLLVVRLLRPVTHGTLVAMAEALPKVLANGGPKAVLADRRGQAFDADIAEGVDFGKKLGEKLKDTGVRIAVLNRPCRPVADVVHAQIHGAGVPLAQFEKEADARMWLIGE